MVSCLLYYDVISPYSWLAFEALQRYKALWNLNLKLKPVFLGGIMNQTGNSPPGLVPAKAAYMNKDLAKLSKHFNVPLRFPSNPAETLFVKGSLRALRMLTAAPHVVKDDEFVIRLSRELWKRAWSKDEDITEDASLIQAALGAGVSEQQARQLLELTKSAAVKEQLQKCTQEAIEAGAFGVPSIVFNGQLYVGSDRFELIAFQNGLRWLGPNPPPNARL